MKKIVNYIVDKRRFLFVLFLIFALCSAWMMTKVTVNKDMIKYLPDDSSMKIGTELLNDEFGEMDTLSSDIISVMFKELTKDEKTSVKETLENIHGINSVDLEMENKEYKKKEYTLFKLHVDSSTLSEKKMISKNIQNEFDGQTIYIDIGEDSVSIPAWIIGIALLFLTVILLIMCSSWLEPLLFLTTILIAVAINMGTNFFLGSVSDTTNSIAALLQLVLSMDYSIILINRYRQEKTGTIDKAMAMKTALCHAFPTIASSAATTIVGLLALVFMRFKIGKDLGVVLAKGVFISLLCIFCILPGLILIFDKWIEQTKKKVPEIKLKRLGSFSYKGRYILPVIFLIIFIGAYVLKGYTPIAYTLEPTNKIKEVFEEDNTMVLLYDNDDESKVSSLINNIQNKENVKNVMGYSSLAKQTYTVNELSDMISQMGSDITFEKEYLNTIYYLYFNGEENSTITISNFMDFITNDIADDAVLGDLMDDELKENLSGISLFTDKEELKKERTITELTQILGIDEKTVNQVLALYAKNQGSGEKRTISIKNFVQFTAKMAQSNPQYESALGSESVQSINTMNLFLSAVEAEQACSEKEMAALMSSLSSSLDKDAISMVYLLYNSKHNFNSSWKMSLTDFMTYISQDLLNDERFKPLFTDEMRNALKKAQGNLQEVQSQFAGTKYSRLIITTYLDKESDETFAFIDNLEKTLKELSVKEYYLIGNSPMAYEMQKSFHSELNNITLLTAIAIFIVVALTFRSFLIPLILIMTIQCGVFLTMNLIKLQGYSIYYLALLIVQCILMGATIDYGILFTNYYREKRNTLDIKDALAEAYHGSSHTILTSASIMVLVTGILGYAFEDPAIGQICMTISKGALCATILILFMLPSLLALFDRFIIKKRK